MNKAIITGKLGADPKIRQSQSGTTIANLSVATNEREKRGDSWESVTEWHRVVCFGRTAENCDRYLSKGSGVSLIGRIKTTSYEKDGIKRYSTEIVADSIEFTDPKGSGGGGGRRQDDYQQGGVPDTYSPSDGGDDDIPF